MGTAYINFRFWDPGTHVLTADIWAKNDLTSDWEPFYEGLEITYFAGSDLKFIGTAVGSAQLVTLDDVTMGLIFVFTGSKYTQGAKAGQFKLGGVTKLSTIGSSILEIDNADDAPVDDTLKERWAGSATISGPMVLESSLPFVPVP